jgi:hypothetical protein
MRRKAKKVAALFISLGILWGTVSRRLRSGDDIFKYFLYFACLPDLTYSNMRHNILRVNKQISINNVLVNWTWTKDNKLVEPVKARMTFVVDTQKGQIVELHSSILPDRNSSLKDISGKY